MRLMRIKPRPRVGDMTPWRVRFAWLPVSVGDAIVWLQRVERRKGWCDTIPYARWCAEHRRVGDESFVSTMPILRPPPPFPPPPRK